MIYVNNNFEKLPSVNFVNGTTTTFHHNLHIQHLPLHPLIQCPHHLRWFSSTTNASFTFSIHSIFPMPGQLPPAQCPQSAGTPGFYSSSALPTVPPDLGSTSHHERSAAPAGLPILPSQTSPQTSLPTTGAHPARPDQDPHIRTKGLSLLLAVLPDGRGIHLVIVVLFGMPHPPHFHVRLRHPQFAYDPIQVVPPLCSHRHDHLQFPIHLHLHHKLGTRRTLPGIVIRLTPRHQTGIHGGNGRNLHLVVVQTVTQPRPQLGNPQDISIGLMPMTPITGLGIPLLPILKGLPLRPNWSTSMPLRPESLSQHSLSTQYHSQTVPRRSKAPSQHLVFLWCRCNNFLEIEGQYHGRPSP